jgi:hypothetical protein
MVILSGLFIHVKCTDFTLQKLLNNSSVYLSKRRAGFGHAVLKPGSTKNGLLSSNNDMMIRSYSSFKKQSSI